MCRKQNFLCWFCVIAKCFSCRLQSLKLTILPVTKTFSNSLMRKTKCIRVMNIDKNSHSIIFGFMSLYFLWGFFLSHMWRAVLLLFNLCFVDQQSHWFVYTEHKCHCEFGVFIQFSIRQKCYLYKRNVFSMNFMNVLHSYLDVYLKVLQCVLKKTKIQILL